MAQNVFFKKGLLANLPSSYAAGTFYVTTDERAMYLDIDDSTRIRLGDFIQVDAVANLPSAGASTSALYYCVAENILAKWNGSTWTQINKQPTAEEMKTLLGLGAMAYKSEVAEGDLNTDLAAKINAASGAQHTHANKDLLDTYTQTNADLADAVAKKHAHTFNETELNKIVEGDVAKWNGVAADHLTAADKTALEDAIKDAKKAGTDANTALESYKVTNDARVLAVEEDIADIVDGTNGVLAQAKKYADDEIAAAKNEISAEIDADVKVVNDALEAYKTSNDTALAGVKATADAAAVKTEVETALAGKVDKVEGKSLIADSEIARLANVTNYDDTQVKADIAKKADAEAMTTELGKKVDKVTGYSLVADTEIARLADVDNYDDTEVLGLIGDNADAIEAISDKIGEVPEDKTVVEMISDAQAAATYDDTQVKADIKANADAIDAIEADYLTSEDKTDLQDQITANANAITILSEGIDADKIDGVKDLIDYVDKHGAEVTGMKEDIAANAKAISDHEALAAETYELKSDATSKKTEIDGRLDALEGKVDVDKVSDAIDLAVSALEQGQVKTNAEAIATKANAADVYTKTETYTKDEVDALINTAHTWGEF